MESSGQPGAHDAASLLREAGCAQAGKGANAPVASHFIALLVMSMANFHLYLPGLDAEQKKQLVRTSKFKSDEVQELMESSEWRAVLDVLEQGARRKKKMPTGGMR